MEVQYRYKTRSVAAFLKQLRHYVEGNHLVGGGHYFYLRFQLAPGKDPDKTAEKLLGDYRIARKKYQRTKRYRGSLPSIHLLVHESDFVIISTYGLEPVGVEDGKQNFLEVNSDEIRDIRSSPLDFRGYSVKYPHVGGANKWEVKLNESTRRSIRDDLIRKATKPRYEAKSAMEAEFRRLGLEGYEQVQVQLGRILREVNIVRRRRRYPLISADCIPSKVTVTKVFVEDSAKRAA